jgi:hypothetical protein
VALNTAGINAILDDGNEAVIYAAIGGGQTASDQTSTARTQLTLSLSNGVITATNAPIAFSGSAGAAATNVLLFSASTGGTFYGYKALTGDQAFNASGAYNLNSLTITGSSS